MLHWVGSVLHASSLCEEGRGRETFDLLQPNAGDEDKDWFDLLVGYETVRARSYERLGTPEIDACRGKSTDQGLNMEFIQ